MPSGSSSASQPRARRAPSSLRRPVASGPAALQPPQSTEPQSQLPQSQLEQSPQSERPEQTSQAELQSASPLHADDRRFSAAAATAGSMAIEGGTAVLLASRIEPHVQPGEIWVTDDIRATLQETDTIFRAEPVKQPAAREDGHVNVKKLDSGEQDMWVKLHRIVS